MGGGDADNSPLQEFDSQSIQPVATRYTDYPILAHPIRPQVLVNSPAMKGIQIILNFTETL